MDEGHDTERGRSFEIYFEKSALKLDIVREGVGIESTGNETISGCMG